MTQTKLIQVKDENTTKPPLEVELTTLAWQTWQTTKICLVTRRIHSQKRNVFLLWPLNFDLDLWTWPRQVKDEPARQIRIHQRSFNSQVIVNTHTHTHTHRTDCSTWVTKAVGNKNAGSNTATHYNTVLAHGPSIRFTRADTAHSVAVSRRTAFNGLISHPPQPTPGPFTRLAIQLTPCTRSEHKPAARHKCINRWKTTFAQSCTGNNQDVWFMYIISRTPSSATCRVQPHLWTWHRASTSTRWHFAFGAMVS